MGRHMSISTTSNLSTPSVSRIGVGTPSLALPLFAEFSFGTLGCCCLWKRVATSCPPSNCKAMAPFILPIVVCLLPTPHTHSYGVLACMLPTSQWCWSPSFANVLLDYKGCWATWYYATWGVIHPASNHHLHLRWRPQWAPSLYTLALIPTFSYVVFSSWWIDWVQPQCRYLVSICIEYVAKTLYR